MKNIPLSQEELNDLYTICMVGAFMVMPSRPDQQKFLERLGKIADKLEGEGAQVNTPS